MLMEQIDNKPQSEDAKVAEAEDLVISAHNKWPESTLISEFSAKLAIYPFVVAWNFDWILGSEKAICNLGFKIQSSSLHIISTLRIVIFFSGDFLRNEIQISTAASSRFGAEFLTGA